MKILLIQPPLEDFYTTPIRLYPLGLLYTATTLRQLGVDVDLIDCLAPPKKRKHVIPAEFSYLEAPFKNDPFLFKGYYRFGLTDEQIMARIKKAQPDMIGISSQFSAYFSSVQRLAELIKSEFDIRIFIGGNHATAFVEEITKRTRAIDDVLAGPAEVALPMFFHQLDGSRFSAKAIDWKHLRPAHDALDSDLYRMGRKKYISLVAGRGCPYKCEFCSVHNMFGRRMDYRPIDDVIAEMHQNYIDKDVRIFNFEDDNLSASSTWFAGFLQRIIDDPVLTDIELTALNGLCYPTLNQDLLQLMRRAGFRRLHLSWVTRSKELRRSLKRPIGDHNLEQIVANAHKLDFFITVHIIIGLPGQSYEEAKNSIDYLLNLDVLVGPSVFYIPAASAIYEKLHLPANVRDNWNFYRSSAFAVETREINRAQLLHLFSYARRQNLTRKEKSGRKA